MIQLSTRHVYFDLVEYGERYGWGVVTFLDEMSARLDLHMIRPHPNMRAVYRAFMAQLRPHIKTVFLENPNQKLLCVLKKLMTHDTIESVEHQGDQWMIKVEFNGC